VNKNIMVSFVNVSCLAFIKLLKMTFCAFFVIIAKLSEKN